MNEPRLFRFGPASIASRIELMPVHNMLNSLALLHAGDRAPAAGEWIRRTAASLTPAQLRANRIVFDELGAALLIDGMEQDFPTYLDALSRRDPATLRDRVWAQQGEGDAAAPEIATLLADPLRLHDLLVSHLRQLWELYGAAEWARIQRSLQQQVERLQRSTPSSGVAPETIMQNLRTLIAGAAAYAPGVQELVFTPSAHTGWSITQLQAGATLYLFFDAELHASVLLRDTPIKQIELIGRLSALTEPARLRVLALLAQHGELTLQDLMIQLDTSQPNVSRYLKSLGHYVSEQRGKDGRKRYRLAPSEIDATFHALKAMVFAASAPATPLQESQMQAQGLDRYLDAQGAVQLWPRQEDDRLAVLGYLADRLAAGETYSEKEINALLTRYVLPHVRDHVTVRRDLIDYRLVQRSGDGTRYWRSAETAAQTARPLSDDEAYDTYWGGA